MSKDAYTITEVPLGSKNWKQTQHYVRKTKQTGFRDSLEKAAAEFHSDIFRTQGIICIYSGESSSQP